ncbi:MAG: S-layer homology domain-containing protein [Oscillospiraceae bacterium]|nr:S-layer homology domain-containing protein [Oscillospiraceae bacterium]
MVYGTDPAHFTPEEPVSRGAFIDFLYRTLNRSVIDNPEPAFQDVLPSNPRFKAARWAADRQISVGDANGLFHQDALCSRAEAVSFLYRAFVIQ